MKRAVESIISVLILTVSLAALPAVAASATGTRISDSATHVAPAQSDRLVARAVTSPACATVQAVGYARCDLVVRRDVAATTQTPAPGALATPSGLLGDNGAYSPAFLQSAYNARALDSASNAGAGRIVAVVDAYDNPALFSDLNYYRNYFGMPACVRGSVQSSNTGCVFQQVNEQGQSSPLPAANQGWGFEEATDVEMISALCANCQILVVEAQSASMTDLGTAVNTAVSLGANVVSNSYGSTEFANEVSLATTYFDHPGVPIVAAAGDNGYGVQFPAAAPSVIAVGGTTLLQTSKSGSRAGSESVWSGTGSGCSAYEPKPAWQHDTLCARRSVNDVAAVANPNTGVWVYDASSGSQMAVAGGTSVAAAVVSALYGLAGASGSANIAPAQLLYASRSSMYQVASGANGTCATYLCDASQNQNGYSGPAGVGTFGASPSSLAAFVAPADPSAPVLANVVTGNGVATLTWSAPLASASTPLGYDVYAGVQTASIQKMNSTPITATSYAVTGLTDGQSYLFTVRAIYATGPSGPSNVVAATPLASLDVPGAPRNVVALAGSAAVTVGWTPPLDTGGVAISSYVASDGHGHSCTVDVSVNVTKSCTVTGLPNGKPVRVSVVAFNAAGPGAASLPSSAVVPARSLGVRQLSVGYDYGCAVLLRATLDCWGANTSGQLGNGTFTASSALAQVVGLHGVVQVASSALDTCAVTSTGSVYCWGANASGQLGNGATVSLAAPSLVQGVTNAVQVSVGTNYACALTSAGVVECWGANADGQLGNVTTTPSSTALEVSGITDATSVVASFNHTCAVLTGGSVACWGSNEYGQLGSSAGAIVSTPQVVSSMTNVTALSLGYNSTCALRSDASVWCWGYNGDGELGRADVASSSSPLQVSGLPAIASLSTGAYGSCAIDVSGVLWCWGYESGSTLTSNVAPVSNVPSIVTQLSSVQLFSRAYSNDYACAVLNSGALVCWTSTSSAPSVVVGSNALVAKRSTSKRTVVHHRKTH